MSDEHAEAKAWVRAQRKRFYSENWIQSGPECLDVPLELYGKLAAYAGIAILGNDIVVNIYFRGVPVMVKEPHGLPTEK